MGKSLVLGNDLQMMFHVHVKVLKEKYLIGHNGVIGCFQHFGRARYLRSGSFTDIRGNGKYPIGFLSFLFLSIIAYLEMCYFKISFLDPTCPRIVNGAQCKRQVYS